MSTESSLKSSFIMRPQEIEKAQNGVFDLVVIGGGITGAGVARDASMRGLSVCLLEKDDFGEGTSSRSSKLAHGGLRYLENFEFDLVGEALHERQNLLKMAPHMVKPLRFLMPLYKGDRVGPLKMKAGMVLYDLLSAFNTTKFHESISKKNIIKEYPKIKNEGLKSGFLYSDALMDDDRLVHETLSSAVEAGACVLSYAEMKSYKKTDQCVEVEVFDKLTEISFSVRAHHAVSCVGPWTDKLAQKVDGEWQERMRPSKGIHITLPKDKLSLKTAVVMAADKDKRILFCIPREGFDIVGTTDTDFSGDPGEVYTDKEDVNYVLNILKEYYPEVEIDFKDILFSYSGVRPLVNDGSASESKVSRSHWIKTDVENKITYISGGKYTTYLAMAEDCVNDILKHSPLRAEKIKTRVPFVEINNAENNKLALKKCSTTDLVEWSKEERRLFVERHGARAFSFIKEKPGVRPEALEAYIAIHYYFCGHLKDFYFRRVPYLLQGLDFAEATYEVVSAVFQGELGLSAQQIKKQFDELEHAVLFETQWRAPLVD